MPAKHTQMELFVEFPEHARLQPHVAANWAIREFFTYLHSCGFVLLCSQDDRVQTVLPAQIEKWILLWHGVDPAKFRAEKITLAAKYGLPLIDEQDEQDEPIERSWPPMITLVEACNRGIVPIKYMAARKRIDRAVDRGDPTPQMHRNKYGHRMYVTVDLVNWMNAWRPQDSETRAVDEPESVVDFANEPVGMDPFARLMEQIKGRESNEQDG